jgi:hypothetical protein
MSVVDKARLALTQCWWCAGCNRLEQEDFRGDDKCQGFRKASADVLIQRKSGKSSDCTETDGHTDNWRQGSIAAWKR